MQIVSNGDNFHEMSNSVFSENVKKKSNVVCWKFYPYIVDHSAKR